MPRFVILEHQTPPHYARPLHWDFMLEMGATLWTWALERPPLPGAGAGDIVAWSLADHRLHYLDYEGPLEGGRGSVARWDAGEFEVRRQESGLLEVLLRGKRLGECLLSLARDEPPHVEGDSQRWTARLL